MNNITYYNVLRIPLNIQKFATMSISTGTWSGVSSAYGEYTFTQSQANNTTTITTKIVFTSYGYAPENAQFTGGVQLGGDFFTGSTYTIYLGNYSTTTIFTRQTTIRHNDNGTFPSGFGMQFNLYSPLSGYTYSAHIYLNTVIPTISRTSVLNSVSDFIIENGFSANVTKHSTTFTDNLRIYMRTGTTDTLLKTISGYTSGTTIAFTIAELNAIYDWLVASNTGTFAFDIQTYSGSTLIGTSSRLTAIGTISNTSTSPLRPLLTNSGVSYRDSNSTTYAITGNRNLFISGISNLEVTLSTEATPRKGAVLGDNAYRFENGTQANQFGNHTRPFIPIVKTFNSVNNSVFRISATDSRLNSSTTSPTGTTALPVTITIPTSNFVPYTAPTFSTDNFLLERNNGTETGIYITFSGTATWFPSTFANRNSIQSVQYRYKLKTSTTWTTWINIAGITSATSGTTITFNRTRYQILSLPVENDYDFEVRVTDTLRTTTKTNLPINASENAIGINVATKNLGFYKLPNSNLPRGTTEVGGDMLMRGGRFEEWPVLLSGNIDLNEITEIGWYSTGSPSSTLVNYPSNWSFTASSNIGLEVRRTYQDTIGGIGTLRIQQIIYLNNSSATQTERMWTRHYGSSGWSNWVPVLPQRIASGNRTSQMRIGSYFIECGTVTIVPSGANTTTLASITFNTTFSTVPKIIPTPHIATPNDVRVSSVNETVNGCDIALFSTTTGSKNVGWLAIGFEPQVINL